MNAQCYMHLGKKEIKATACESIFIWTEDQTDSDET